MSLRTGPGIVRLPDSQWAIAPGVTLYSLARSLWVMSKADLSFFRRSDSLARPDLGVWARVTFFKVCGRELKFNSSYQDVTCRLQCKYFFVDELAELAYIVSMKKPRISSRIDFAALVDLFLTEKIELKALPLKRAARYRVHLLGLPSHTAVGIGFSEFLRTHGVPSPSARDLNSATTKLYYRHLIRNRGTIPCREAMRTLRLFSIWCRKNGLTSQRRIPRQICHKRAKPFGDRSDVSHAKKGNQ